jgi:hypothetical protein
MLDVELDQLGKSGLRVVLDASLDEIRVRLSGSCARETLPHLPGFLGNLHQEAQRTRARQVVVDCENLYFMSSAAIKCFVTWIAKLKDVPQDRRYMVEFRTNKRLQWQERSMSAISRFAPSFTRLA